jgi:multiple sugar transport system permease protein
VTRVLSNGSYTETQRRLARRRSRSQALTHLGLHVLLLAGALTMVVPFLWMLSSSVKDDSLIFRRPPVWIPPHIRWENYATIWRVIPFGLYYLNSIQVTTYVTIGVLLTSSLAGFAFARIRFPYRDAAFLLYLGTMMIPEHVTMIPTFVIVRTLGWTDDLKALIVPWLFSPFGTFLMRQFFLSMPKELEDAAEIDGANPLGVLWRIFLPLSRPALATLGVFTILASWNDFLWPLVVLNKDRVKTVTLGLASFQTQYAVRWNLLMAASVVSLLPVLALFLFAQRFFTQGIALTGIKG